MLCGISKAQKLAPRPNQVQTVMSKLAIGTRLSQHGVYKLSEQYRSEVHRQELPWPGICPDSMAIAAVPAFSS